jgi:hypothetical protein
MDTEMIRLIRERYLFPIAHAYKKTLGLIHDDAQKLKCLIQTAETVIQFLAPVMLAQLHHDLQHLQAPALGRLAESLRDALRRPSFGKWQEILRDVLKSYREHRHLLVIPELFDFYFRPAPGNKLAFQPVISQAIDPLIGLRNQFHHPGIQEALIPESIAAGLGWLDDILVGLRFLSTYELAFVQRIEVRHPSRGRCDASVMTSCR